MSSRLSWPAGLRPWRRWIIALFVLLVARAALPLVLRSVIASQASKALHARVEVGDVDLALYKLGVALKDVAVRQTSPLAEAGPVSGGPPPPATPDAATDGHAKHGDTAPADEPLISWKRFEVSVRWLPLFKKRIVLRDIELDSPRIALDRLADGKLNLMALVPSSGEEAAAPPTPAPTGSKGAGWGFGLDHLVLRDGAVRFRDFKVKDSEPIELHVPTVEVTDIYLIPGLYGEPSKASVTVAVDKGSLQLEATLVQRSATENQLEAYLKARNLPVRRARLYIPKVGWSALDGGFDADITYNLDTGVQNAVRGSATVSDFSVRVANLDEPALGWKSLTVKIDPVDLLAQRAVVSAVDLNGAILLVRPSGGDLLPFLAAVGTDHESAPAAQNAAPPAAEAGAAPPSSAAAAPTETAPPWRWAVSAVHIADTRVRLLGAAAPFDVGVGLDLTDLADHADQPAHLALALTAGQGTVNVDGGVRVAPPGFGGTLKVADLSLPELGAAAGALPKDVLQAARFGSDLTVEAGLAANGAGGALPAHDVRIQGKLSLADVRLTPPSPPGVSVGVGSVDLALTELQVPGVLPGQVPAAPADGVSAGGGLPPGDVLVRGKLGVGDVKVAAAGPQGYTFALHSLDLGMTELLAHGAIPTAMQNAPGGASTGDVQVGGKLAVADLQLAGVDAKAFAVDVRSFELPFKEIALPGVIGGATAAAGRRPMHVALGDIRLTAPSVRITRTAQGLVLPNFSGASQPAEATSPSAEETRPAAAAQPAPTAAAAASPSVQVAVDSFRLSDGNVAVLDRTVKPFFQGGFSRMSIEVTKLRWPDLAIGNLHFAATGAEKGKLDVYGALASDGGWLQVYVDQLALVPFNPYATTFSGYSIGTGKASIVSKVSVAKARYDASNYLTLHNLDVRGGAGESLFRENFGIPLSMVLALMRDTEGNIGLDIPVTVDQEGTTIGIGTVIRGALQRAIMGALVSPLKMVGAVFSGDKIESVVPPAIAFLAGRPEFAPRGTEQVEQLSALLASRPGIGVTLDTTVTPIDVRWLREQALRDEWAGQGMFAKLKGLPQRGARERIDQALEARAKDKEGNLDPEDAKTLDHWLDERPPIPAERLQALADARLAHVEEVLRDQNGVDAARIARRAAPADTAADTDTPAVRVELGAVGALAGQAAP